ncbi:50S ribosomal protein L25 [Facklamia hominis]|uniref:Large ribosomal subunit protein bL25 n=1 Tax=Facklamia hominis CCUG 36813 TaxID=883111 RepID=K1LMV3_9LACT|nr:50S ribosomal protein L25 [Facklamia hominis]EKB53392.1 ribosomal protein L25, Ctc-form [Facklamia hominis CCUG 36813]EPH11642.1 ribosomal protein L25, Ctc-form [Facklamia hominis ACS-120-V-Sch10]RYC97947.1 50S ribosomal protein L25 [Facklamia hominis]WPJ90216.1 50S ribosomal protein L25 [Facklamia hominis]
MSIKAELRTKTGTGASKQARREGKIPATLYGKEVEATSLLVSAREFEALLKAEGSNAVFDVEFDGKTQQVILKDFEKASLKDHFYSIDLEAISANQKLQVEVPLVLLNEETVKVGIVAQVFNTIEIETTPANIPNAFEIDVKGMEIGDTKSISDLELPAGVEILEDAEETIVSVIAPTEEPAEDEESEAAEPEVIGEKEDEE